MGADRSFACQVNAFRTSFSRLVSSQSVNHRDKRPNRPNLPIRLTARSEDGGIAQSRYYACNDRTGEAEWEEQMATGQKRGTREKKKPKASKKVRMEAKQLSRICRAINFTSLAGRGKQISRICRAINFTSLAGRGKQISRICRAINFTSLAGRGKADLSNMPCN